MMPTESGPLASRLTHLRLIMISLDEVRERLQSIPLAYHTDVSAQLRYLADEIDQALTASVEKQKESSCVASPKAAEGVKSPLYDPDLFAPDSSPTAAKGRAVADPDLFPPKPSPNDGIRQRIFTYFVQRENKPATAMEIAAAVGARLSGVTTLLYKRNDGSFVRVGSRATKAAPMKLWQLSVDAFVKAASDDVAGA